MHFRYFVIISFWKRTGPFIWTNMNYIHSRMLCTKFGWKWPSGSEVNFLKNFMMNFHYFFIISPKKKGGAPHLNKLEFHSPEDALCKDWLKLAKWFWKRISKNSLMYYRFWVIIFPCGLSCEQTWIYFIQVWFVLSLVEIGTVVLEKNFKISSIFFHTFVLISPWKKA